MRKLCTRPFPLCERGLGTRLGNDDEMWSTLMHDYATQALYCRAEFHGNTNHMTQSIKDHH